MCWNLATSAALGVFWLSFRARPRSLLDVDDHSNSIASSIIQRAQGTGEYLTSNPTVC
jgi:hypothetical protein